MTEITIRIRGPHTRALYSPLAASLLGAVGAVTIRRVSQVEPGGELSDAALHWLAEAGQPQPAANTWHADLLRVQGPVLGPYTTRDEALAAEIQWLRQHGLPSPTNEPN